MTDLSQWFQDTADKLQRQLMKYVGDDDRGNALFVPVVALEATDITIGDVAIDQTTPGVSNGVVAKAGEAHIGVVAGAMIRPASYSIIRPSDTTAYTIGDAVGCSLAITGASNATPIVATCTAHGLSDGDPVTISSVGGNTNANGNFYAKVTGYSVNTFALYSDFALATPIAGNGAYTSGGVLAKAFRLKNAVRVAGGSGFITRLNLKSSNADSSLQCRAHIYQLPATGGLPIPLDNLLWNPLLANDYWMGSVDLPVLGGNATAVSGAAATATWLGQFAAVADAGMLDFVIILQALTATTPISGSTHKLNAMLGSVN